MSSYSSIESTRTARSFLVIHLVVLLLSTGLSYLLLSPANAEALLLGSLLLSVSLLSLYLAIYWGMVKKKIILSIGVIVFKWPLLIYIVLQSLNRTGNVPFVYVAIGLSTWLISALVWAGYEKMELGKRGRTL